MHRLHYQGEKNQRARNNVSRKLSHIVSVSVQCPSLASYC
jgi:hypothetical protein